MDENGAAGWKSRIISKRIPAHPLGIFCAAHRPVIVQDLFGVLIPEFPFPSTEIQKRSVGIMSFFFFFLFLIEPQMGFIFSQFTC